MPLLRQLQAQGANPMEAGGQSPYGGSPQLRQPGQAEQAPPPAPPPQAPPQMWGLPSTPDQALVTPRSPTMAEAAKGLDPSALMQFLLGKPYQEPAPMKPGPGGASGGSGGPGAY